MQRMPKVLLVALVVLLVGLGLMALVSQLRGDQTHTDTDNSNVNSNSTGVVVRLPVPVAGS